MRSYSRDSSTLVIQGMEHLQKQPLIVLDRLGTADKKYRLVLKRKKEPYDLKVQIERSLEELENRKEKIK